MLAIAPGRNRSKPSWSSGERSVTSAVSVTRQLAAGPDSNTSSACFRASYVVDQLDNVSLLIILLEDRKAPSIAKCALPWHRTVPQR